MSEQSGGPGWWQASDGKWYPPEQAPTAAQPAYGAPVPAPAPAPGPAAAGGGGASKVIAIVVVLALLAGGGAYLLTKGSGGSSGSVADFCAKATAAKNDIKFEDIINPARVDAIASAFDQLAKSAPTEIKSDMNTLNDAIKRERANVKAGKSPDDGFSGSDNAKLTTASANIEKFAKDKCGLDLNSNSSFSLSTRSFDTSSLSSFTSGSSSFDSSSFDSSLSSQAEALCSQFGTDFGTDFCSSS